VALSSEAFSTDSGRTLLAMITSAKNPPWPMDLLIDAASVGLKSASKVRMKLFTLDNRLILQKIGSLSAADRRAVDTAIQRLLIRERQ
jgi:mRNA interferase MazF